MLKQIIGKKVIELAEGEFKDLISGYSEIVFDLGTGDGKFAYDFAKETPDQVRGVAKRLVIGIDADKSQMEEVSHKVSRKPAKGGLDNLIYLWHAVEELPAELFGLADQIYINFPWGSLLKGVMRGDEEILAPILNLAKPDGQIHIYVSYDRKFEEQTIAELELPELTLAYINSELKYRFKKQGIKLTAAQTLGTEEKRNLLGSWPKRILSKRDREVFLIEAEVKGAKSAQQHSYAFTCHGHPNIRATHPKTIEFTKDQDITERGDCIIGVDADFDLGELKKFTGKLEFRIKVKNKKQKSKIEEDSGLQSGNFQGEFVFKCKVNPGFNSEHELVLRKSGFDSERTFGFGLDKGANKLPRELVALLQEGVELEVVISGEAG